MASCRYCEKTFPIITIRDVRHQNPLGGGFLCKECYTPYRIVLETYTASKIKADTDPKAAAWVALCYILSAQRVNLVRTLTAILCGIFETKNSWEVCRQHAMDLTKKAMAMLPSNSQGQVFLQGLFRMAEKISEPPQRQIPIQLHASPLGSPVRDIEYEAVRRSGASIDELNHLVASLPGHQWLRTP
jgi:hypothetical protein